MGRGWFESDEEYRARITREDYETTVGRSTGSPPKQGWFESDNRYASRIKDEANEAIISSPGGEVPAQGWFESDSDYRARITTEAHEAVIGKLTDEAPARGWFESETDYTERVRHEAYVSRVASSTRDVPRQGWFESAGDFRERVSLEAREAAGSALGGAGGGGAAAGEGLGILGAWGLVAGAFVLGAIFLPNFWNVVTGRRCGTSADFPCAAGTGPLTVARPGDAPSAPPSIVLEKISYGRDLVNGVIVDESPTPPVAPANLTVRFQYRGARPGQTGSCRLSSAPDMAPTALAGPTSAFVICHWNNVPAGNYAVGFVVDGAVVVQQVLHLVSTQPTSAKAAIEPTIKDTSNSVEVIPTAHAEAQFGTGQNVEAIAPTSLREGTRAKYPQSTTPPANREHANAEIPKPEEGFQPPPQNNCVWFNGKSVC